MSLYNYIDSPNPNLVCCICRAPFTDPTTTITCSHTFCADCILRALTHASSCPIDRTPLSPSDLVPANPIVRCLVDELRVECVYSADGCTHISQRQDMPSHLRDECSYAEVQCNEDECSATMRRKELEAHKSEAHQLVEERVKEEEVEDTKSEDTTESYSCPHAAVGCPYRGPLQDSEHLSSCPYESLKGFFATNSAKMSLLTEQNIILRHKVDTLEHTLHTLRKEMHAAKNALGPWFRASYNPGNLNSSSGGVPMSMLSSELPIGMQAATAGPSGFGMDRGDLLASYFPAEDNFRPLAMGHRMSSSMGESVYSRAGGVVAPLDLGSTLEGTLAGLRESVVGLAAGLESVGRRGEIALTNETLRLGEEMMSVRAQMHGLRMQVHGMMMDRNAAALADGQYLPVRTNMNFGGAGSITKL